MSTEYDSNSLTLVEPSTRERNFSNSSEDMSENKSITTAEASIEAGVGKGNVDAKTTVGGSKSWENGNTNTHSRSTSRNEKVWIYNARIRVTYTVTVGFKTKVSTTYQTAAITSPIKLQQ